MNNENENRPNEYINKRKILVPTIVAIFTLLVLVVGATYAYINVTATLNFGTLNISGSVPVTTTVSITKGSNITMALSRTQLMQQSADQTYYANTNGVSTSAVSPVIATVKAAANSAGTYDCTYTMNVKGNPYTMATNSVGKGAGLFTLTINYYNASGTLTADTIDFNTAQTGNGAVNSSTGKTYTGKVTGITNTTGKTMTAQLKFINSHTVDQTALNNTSATFAVTVSAFNCVATA